MRSQRLRSGSNVDINNDDEVGEKEVVQVVRVTRNILQYVRSSQNSANTGQLDRFQPLLNKSSSLIKQVAVRLLEKNARRVVRKYKL